MTNESEVSFSLSLEGFPAMTATHRWFFRSSDDRTRVNSARQSHRKLFRMGILVTDHETRTHHINASPLHPSKMLDLQAHIPLVAHGGPTNRSSPHPSHCAFKLRGCILPNLISAQHVHPQCYRSTAAIVMMRRSRPFLFTTSSIQL